MNYHIKHSIYIDPINERSLQYIQLSYYNDNKPAMELFSIRFIKKQLNEYIHIVTLTPNSEELHIFCCNYDQY